MRRPQNVLLRGCTGWFESSFTHVRRNGFLHCDSYLYVTLSTLGKFFSRRHIDFFFYFSQKTGFDISCKLVSIGVTLSVFFFPFGILKRKVLGNCIDSCSLPSFLFDKYFGGDITYGSIKTQVPFWASTCLQYTRFYCASLLSVIRLMTETHLIFMSLGLRACDIFTNRNLDSFIDAHYENTPIKMYWKFHHQNLKVFR